jgi:hypothetical protein
VCCGCVVSCTDYLYYFLAFQVVVIYVDACVMDADCTTLDKEVDAVVV